MGNFFRWLWTGFGTMNNALRALGITICIFLIGFILLWWIIKLIVKVVNKISSTNKAQSETQSTVDV